MSKDIKELTYKIIDLVETAKKFGYVGSYSFNYNSKSVEVRTGPTKIEQKAIITGEYIMISLDKNYPASVDEIGVPEAPEK